MTASFESKALGKPAAGWKWALLIFTHASDRIYLDTMPLLCLSTCWKRMEERRLLAGEGDGDSLTRLFLTTGLAGLVVIGDVAAVRPAGW